MSVLGINQKTNRFMEALAELINESELPACNIRLSLDLVRNQVAELERRAIAQEQQAAEANAAKPKAEVE